MEEKNNNSIANKVGRIMGAVTFAVLCSCALAILVALTYKLVMWII